MFGSPLLYVTTILIWGSTWYAIKFQLGVVSPHLSLFYRFGLAALILLAYCLYTGKDLRLKKTDHLFIAAQGLCLFSINYLIFYYASNYLTSGLVAVVFSTVIFMNILNGAIFLKRAIIPRVLAGAGFGVLGLCLVFWHEIQATTDVPTVLKGLLYSLVATYFASLGNILSARNQQAGLPVVETNTLGMGYGALLMLAMVWVSSEPVNFEFTTAYVTSLLYLAVFGSILAFGAYLTLVGRIGADRAAYATVLFPIVALIISGIFEDFQWSLLSISGVVLVLIGNLLVTRKATATT